MNSANDFHEHVVVITGASSGIGLATAIAFARRGACLALGARRVDALHLAVEACTAAGGHAIAVPTDVTTEFEVVGLARAAIETFGHIDVWINNAGVGLFGPFASAEIAAHRRVIETNLFGAMHGAAAVLPYFLRQRHGVLITNISVGGLAPVPFAAAYTASKFGLRGFMASLRQELRHVPGIRVCSLFPATVDTPGFQHGANVSGRKLELSPALVVLSPQEVAEAMISLAEHPRDELPLGWPTRLAKTAYSLAPLTTERAAGAYLRSYVRRGEPESKTMGNLFTPIAAGTSTDGGWRASPRTRTATVLAGGLLAIAAALTTLALLRRQRPSASSRPRRPMPPQRRTRSSGGSYLEERVPHTRYAG